MRNIIIISIFLIGMSISLFAGGYQVRLQGQKQTGMGLIGTSTNFGASSIFYNPGALSMMKTEYSFQVGANFINSNVIYQSTTSSYTAETDNPLSTPAYLYGAAKLSDKLTLGVGFYTPYGSSAKWDKDWAGKNLIQEISLQAFYIQPTLSYKINDKLGIGAGLVLVQGNVDLQKALPYSEQSYTRLKGSDFGAGFNIGVYYHATQKLNIGIAYRSQITMKVDGGTAIFRIPESLESIVAPNNKFSAELPLPANLDFGISYQVTEKFLAALEINYVFWGSYKELSFTFEEDGDILNNINTREYSNTLIPRLGLEYKLNNMFIFRAGGYFDPTPTNEKYFTPETVSLDTWAYTFGLSIMAYKNLSVDLTYLGTHGKESVKMYEPDNFEGRYKTAASIFGIGINYNF
ncbi:MULTISPECIES: OmpP1/FadL family transporter [unclassified Lentimicrobium]|uniref:OmpP1/FadL family transporter n=1 Tax=unclassified Lentimicrobium TaxID=2677434 RepID=UPI001554E944|nr:MULTISPECIES: outer membrane protein transport protein [unclassified Lentimicrobium]NPD46601.1 hydrocarbon degradation protein [Lentimicrobium sp. S6]NPD83820.1 hydrocarbon degradation protein [Lentimicrobium sp. L6]